MNELISIRIVRPQLQDLNAEDRKCVIADLAKSIAQQIVIAEDQRLRDLEIQRWQEIMLGWKIEDIRNEIVYGRLKTDDTGN